MRVGCAGILGMGFLCLGSWGWLGCIGVVVASVLCVVVFGVVYCGVGACWGGGCAVCVVLPCGRIDVGVLTLWRMWRGWWLMLWMGWGFGVSLGAGYGVTLSERHGWVCTDRW